MSYQIVDLLSDSLVVASGRIEADMAKEKPVQVSRYFWRTYCTVTNEGPVKFTCPNVDYLYLWFCTSKTNKRVSSFDILRPREAVVFSIDL